MGAGYHGRSLATGGCRGSRRACFLALETGRRNQGKVRGYFLNGTDIFKGIPYGAPTGGARRFLAPVKPQPWLGVRSCLSYGHACPQLSGGIPAGDNQTHGDEDTFLSAYFKRGADTSVRIAVSEGPIRSNAPKVINPSPAPTSMRTFPADSLAPSSTRSRIR
jgi:hypothetical protein